MVSDLALMGARGSQLRLAARVARAYHEQGMRQAEIAEAFHISQPRVSRLLKAAVAAGIVRTTVTVPPEVNIELTETLEQAYGIKRALVVDAEGEITPALGAAAASYLSNTLLGTDTMGISSWSASVIATAYALSPFRTKVVDNVVQLVGGMGNPQVQMQATQLIGQLASYTGADPILLPTPGILGSVEARDALVSDPVVADVAQTWSRLTIALIGIGGIEPSDLASQSGNVFPTDDLAALEAAGAVGDVCFRFINRDGELVRSSFDDRVIAIDPDVLRAVPRRVGIAGGSRKVEAIRGAMLGGWINILVTDRTTAEHLVKLAT
ncbi:MAG: sugar-binding transcriptional regulator [Promicromonosporaceae bacterium]|nr:sugar-binding transcriptional regulator [Promicromonosporaceae bacterium]